MVTASDTLPARFWRVAAQRKAAVALRWNHLGLWNDISWADYAEAVRALGLGLLAMGGRRGDRAVVLSDVRPEWCQIEFGAMGVGIQSVGLHHTDSAGHLAQVVQDSAARWLFVQDQAQLEKALSVLGEMPGIEKIFFFDGSGLHALAHPLISNFETALQAGRSFHGNHPERWETEVGMARPEDVATIVYTSGRTGVPKGVLLTHSNLMFQMQALGQLCPSQPGDDQLGFLSMGAVLERYFSLYRALDHDIVVHLGKGLPTLLDNLREISPHIVMAVPRVWEKLYATVSMGVAEGTPMERWAYAKAIAFGYRVAACRQSGQAVPMGLSLQYAFARQFVLNRVRTLLGLRRARLLMSSAAPISPALTRWFEALDLTMVEAYGQTECSGVVTISRPAEGPSGTVGKALPGTEIRLSPQGEILVRGPHVFRGYLQPAREQAGNLTDGWLPTGDRGRLDAEANLYVTDRIADAIELPSGVRVSPADIESRLKLSPYIADAIVLGNGQPHLVCLLLIEQETVARHVRERKLVVTGFANLTRAAEVRALIQQDIDRVNREIGPHVSVGRFALLETEITVHDAEMTPTLQLRRKMVLEINRSLVERLLAGPAD
jgi:long-chain acyl-CoA synthetase